MQKLVVNTVTRRSCQTSKILPTNQPIPKPIRDRSGQPDNTQDVFVVIGKTSHSQEIKVKSFHEELTLFFR